MASRHASDDREQEGHLRASTVADARFRFLPDGWFMAIEFVTE